jgi:UDP-N-acetylmuramyl pentapeptide phosphotransferase/UDP-N-acetylglucosamine-1-phosphate transferase
VFFGEAPASLEMGAVEFEREPAKNRLERCQSEEAPSYTLSRLTVWPEWKMILLFTLSNFACIITRTAFLSVTRWGSVRRQSLRPGDFRV